MIKKIIFFSFATLFIFNSCDSLDGPIDKLDVSIICNLTANAGIQQIYLYKTASLNENLFDEWQRYINPDFFIKDAQVLVYDTSNFAHEFSLNSGSNMFYKNTSALKIEPETEYRISININDKIYNGSTIVPGDFNIITPKSNEIIIRTPELMEIPIVWTKSKNAMLYIVNIYKYSSYSNSYTRQISAITIDTFYTFREEPNYPTNENSSPYKIEIQSFDKNFYEHVISNFPNAGIKNAYGYVGSSVFKFVNATVTQQTN